jgi:MFS family permease
MKRPLALGLLSLYLPTLAVSIGQGAVIPAIPTLTAGFGVSAGLAGQVITAFAIGRLLSLFAGGLLVDRIGSRLPLYLGSLLIAVGAMLMALAPAFWLVLVGQLLAGGGNGMWLVGREVVGLNIVGPGQRGRLMSGFFGLQMAGMAFGPIVGGIGVDLLGFRPVFFAYAVIGLAVVASNGFIAHVGPASRPSSRGGGGREPSAWRFGTNEIAASLRTTFWVLVFATFSMSLYRNAVNSILPLYAGLRLEFSGTQIGTLFGISGALVAVMIIPAGFVLDKLGRKWAAVPAAILPAIAFVMIPFSSTMLELTVVSVLLGIAGGISLGSLATYSYDVIPAGSRGRLQALRRGVGDLGGLVGPALGGVITNGVGPGSAFLIYSPLLMITALLLLFLARETLERSWLRRA